MVTDYFISCIIIFPHVLDDYCSASLNSHVSAEEGHRGRSDSLRDRDGGGDKEKCIVSYPSRTCLVHPLADPEDRDAGWVLSLL